jgi:uncharacterized protein (TIGR02996 family)
MDTQQAFLRAIIEEPDDDTHRLVFADWLDDDGQSAWAALIRAQCGLNRLLLPCDDPYSDPGLLVVDRLNADARKQVLAAVQGVFGPLELDGLPCRGWFRWRVRRGMIETVELWGQGITVFVETAKDILQRVPLRDVILRAYRWPALEQDYPNQEYAEITQETFDALLRVPEVARLRNLDLRGCAVSGHLPSLAEFGERFQGGHVWAHGYPISNHGTAAERVRAALGKRLMLRLPPGDNPSDEIPF